MRKRIVVSNYMHLMHLKFGCSEGGLQSRLRKEYTRPAGGTENIDIKA